MDTHATPAGDDHDGIAGDETAAASRESHEPDDWFEHPRGGPRRPGRPNSARTWIAAGVVAVAIGVAAILGVNAVSSGSTSTSAAAGLNARGPGGGGPGRPGGHGIVGTIASVNGSTLKITTPSGQTETVATSASTRVSTGVSGSSSDIKVGDHLLVMGSGSSTTITAQQITDRGTATDPAGPAAPPNGASQAGGEGGAPSGPPPGGTNGGPGGTNGGPGGTNGGPGGGGGFAAGTVTSVDGSAVTLRTPSGSTVTVTTSSATTVTVVETGSVSDLTVGEQVVVDGKSSSGTITATMIRAGSGLPTGPGGANGSGGPSGNA